MLLSNAAGDRLKGRRVTTVDFLEAELKLIGADFQKAKDPHKVEVDGNLITGSVPECIPNALSNLYERLGMQINFAQ